MSMTVEQIELRRILSQMLADNGINRETIKDMVKEIISEKTENAVKQTISHETNMDSLIHMMVKDEIKRAIREEVSNKVRRTLGNVSISIECYERLKD